MGIVDIITLVITFVNSLFVAVLSIQNIKREQQEKINSKKKIWYETEVISAEKINKHIKDLEIALMGETDKIKICEKINSVMLDFFYTSVNYVVFLNSKYCEQIKQNIMAAVDDIMYALVYNDEQITDKDKAKLLKMYRIKIMSLFYDFDIKLEGNL